jgi:hypothetical protein
LAWLIAAAGLTPGCAADQAPAEAGDFAIEVAGLATCGGTNAKPLSEIKSLKLVVREPNSTGGLSVVDSQTVSVSGGGTVNFKEVPAGSPREVTLLGYNAGGKEPAWYARRTGVNIKKNVTTDLDVTLMAMGGLHLCRHLGRPAQRVVSVCHRHGRRQSPDCGWFYQLDHRRHDHQARSPQAIKRGCLTPTAALLPPLARP